MPHSGSSFSLVSRENVEAKPQLKVAALNTLAKQYIAEAASPFAELQAAVDVAYGHRGVGCSARHNEAPSRGPHCGCFAWAC